MYEEQIKQDLCTNEVSVQSCPLPNGKSEAIAPKLNVLLFKPQTRAILVALNHYCNIWMQEPDCGPASTFNQRAAAGG